MKHLIILRSKPSDTTHWTHQVHYTQGLDYIGKNPIDEGESVSDYQKRVEKHMNDNPVWVLNDGHTYTMNSHIHVDKTLEGVDSTDNVLTHEMGHRMENVIPDDKLTRMESAFIRRRFPIIQKTTLWHLCMVTSPIRQMYILVRTRQGLTLGRRRKKSSPRGWRAYFMGRNTDKTKTTKHSQSDA